MLKSFRSVSRDDFIEIINRACQLVSDIVFLYQPESDRILLANESACATLEYEPSDFEDLTLSQIQSKNLHDWKRICQLVLKEDPVTECRICCKSKSGKQVTLYCTATRMRSSDQDCVLIVGKDITEHEQTREALRESEKRYSEMLEHLPVGVGIVLDNKVKFVNSELARLTGFKREELIGEYPVVKMLAPEDIDRAMNRVQALQEGAGIYPSRYKFRKKTGEIFPVEVHSRPDVINGKPALISVIMDMSERVRLEENILASNERLQQLLRHRTEQLIMHERLASVGRILAGFVHQIGNPLQSIHGSLDRLRESSLQVEPLDNEHARIRKHILRIEKLCAQLRALYKPQKDKLESIDINQVIVDVLELFAYELSKSKISCDVNLDPTNPRINATANGLYNIVSNLLSNAIESIETDGDIQIITRKTDESVTLTVEDSGAGIDELDFEHIFDLFYTTKVKQHGTGLGLYLVQEAVKRADGEINVVSRPGEGARFEIIFNSRSTPTKPIP